MEMLQDLAWGGINATIPVFGGLECKYHVSSTQRLIETVIGTIIGSFSFKTGLSLMPNIPEPKSYECLKPSKTRTALLVMLSLVFGVEIGYKFVSKSSIYLLYPCHVVSMLWIYLLAASISSSTPSKNKVNLFIYRCLIHVTHGTMMAIAFPVDDVLELPMERVIFWLQHYLILIIPIYMIYAEPKVYPLPPRGGDSAIESLVLSWPWVLIAFGVWLFYHFIVIQPVSFWSWINIGFTLCPSPTDPFPSDYYRMIGIVHQFLCGIISGTIIRLCALCGGHEVNIKTK